jgi:hypothetical protein
VVAEQKSNNRKSRFIIMPAKIIAGDFAEGSTLVDNWNTLAIMPLGLSFKNVKLDGQVQSVDLVTEQNKEAFLGAGGWATRPLSNQVIQALARIFSGSNQLEVCLACRLADGRKFVAIAERKVYDKLYAEALKTQLNSPSVAQPVVGPPQLATAPAMPQVPTSSRPQTKSGAQMSGSTKGCLGCLGVFVFLGVLGNLLESVTKPQQPDEPASVSAPKATSKPKLKPTPAPTETARQRRRRLAEQQAARKAREEKAEQERLGERIKNSAWDGAVPAVVDYLKANLKDYNSAEWIEWSEVSKTEKGYMVRCKYRAKNSFGGYGLYNQVFFMDKNGNVVSHMDLE